MSTLAEVNTAIAAWQDTQAGLATQATEVQLKRAALEESAATGQANIDAAIAARDTAVANAQTEFNTAFNDLSALEVTQSYAFTAALDAISSYVP